MGDDKTAHVRSLLQRLAERIGNDGRQEPLPKEKITSMVSYATRVMSTVVSPEVQLDELHVTELVKKRCTLLLVLALSNS